MLRCFSRVFGIRFFFVLILLVVTILGAGALRLFSGSVLRDPYDLFSLVMMSPVALMFPLFTAAVGSAQLFTEVRWRFAAQAVVRSPPERYVRGVLLAGASAAFLLFFLSTAAVGVISFAVWAPGNPQLFDVSVYALTPESVAGEVLTRASYSQLMQWGPAVAVLGYAGVLGVGGAAFATLGNIGVLCIRRIWPGLVLPFALYLGQSVLFAAFSAPFWGLMFALYPYGLEQQPVVVALVPVLVLAAVAASVGVWVTRSASNLPNLR